MCWLPCSLVNEWDWSNGGGSVWGGCNERRMKNRVCSVHCILYWLKYSLMSFGHFDYLTTATYVLAGSASTCLGARWSRAPSRAKRLLWMEFLFCVSAKVISASRGLVCLCRNLAEWMYSLLAIVCWSVELCEVLRLSV